MDITHGLDVKQHHHGHGLCTAGFMYKQVTRSEPQECSRMAKNSGSDENAALQLAMAYA